MHSRSITSFRRRDPDDTEAGFNKPRTPTKAYWAGPASMLTALVAAILVAIAHHFFYQYLNGRFVVSFALSQAWVNNIATALAFLSKLMFVIASSIAYVQRQWLELSKNDHEIKQVDDLTNILDDITLFFQIKTWFRKPILLCVAIIIWSLPIASVFTPGTLSVQAVRHNNQTNVQVPQISYADLHAYVQTRSVSGYVGPAVQLSKLAMATATSGQILNIPSAYQNESYDVQFEGPALRCSVSSNQGLFAMALQQGLLNDSTADAFDAINYIAFVGGDDHGFLGTNLSNMASDSSSYATLDQTSNDTARLYVMPGHLSYNLSQAALIECQLYNATYDVGFNFNFPFQTVKTNSIKYLNPVNATLGYCPIQVGVHMCDIGAPHPFDHMSYQAIMDAFGGIIVGAESSTNSDPSVGWNQTFYTSRRLTAIDWDSTEAALQGLEQLFQNITFSTMSLYPMTQNSSITNPIPVTVTTFPNIYQYDPKVLILSYGLSLLFALICIAIGFHATWINQASYTNQFSTYLRAAWNRNPDIDVYITGKDRGSEPLAKAVGEAKVRLHGDCSLPISTSRLGTVAV